jgi:hypothetical protein
MDQDKNRRKQPQTIKRDPFDGWMDGRILQKLDQRDQVIHERRPPKPEKGRTRGTRWHGTPAAHLYCICTIMDHAIMPCRVRRKSGTTCGSENMSCGVTRPRPRPRDRDRDRDRDRHRDREDGRYHPSDDSDSHDGGAAPPRRSISVPIMAYSHPRHEDRQRAKRGPSISVNDQGYGVGGRLWRL